mmetsp:Transcript_35717/g.83046  ORF Transcript_35717/g.83046 Transcript_35717/m.83046 type:complete len:370 (+) Transcript_35717:434-1543(+)
MQPAVTMVEAMHNRTPEYRLSVQVPVIQLLPETEGEACSLVVEPPIVEHVLGIAAQLIRVAEGGKPKLRFIGVLLAVGNPWWDQLVAQDLVKEAAGGAVSGPEEVGTLDVLPAVLARAQSPVRLLAQHPLQQRLPRLVVVTGGHAELPLKDGSDDILVLGMMVPERQAATDKLEEEHAERPDIDLVAVAMAHDHLRGHVVQRPCHCEGVLNIPKLFRETKVNQFQVASPVQKHVLWLQVSVHYLPVMKSFQGQHQRTNVELRLASHEETHPHHVVVQGTTSDQLCQDVETVYSLKGLHQTEDERVVQFGKDGHLLLHIWGQPAILLLANAFQGQILHRPRVLHETHCAKSAYSNKSDMPQAFQSQACIL